MPARRPTEQFRAVRHPVDHSRNPIFTSDFTRAAWDSRHKHLARRDSAIAVPAPAQSKANNGASKLALPKVTTTVANPAKRKASDEADTTANNEPTAKRAKLATKSVKEVPRVVSPRKRAEMDGRAAEEEARSFKAKFGGAQRRAEERLAASRPRKRAAKTLPPKVAEWRTAEPANMADKNVVWKGKEAGKKAGAKPAIEVHQGLTMVPLGMLPKELVKQSARSRQAELDPPVESEPRPVRPHFGDGRGGMRTYLE